MYPDHSGDRKIYLGMVTAMDDFVGNVTSELKASGLYENTVMVFISDNGGSVPDSASNEPLKGTKGLLYEGAVRTPSFINSPLLHTSG